MAGNEYVEVIEVEDPREELMEIDDIAAEPLNSTRINRCGHCRRMQYGHPVPYGAGKCLLDKINDDQTLKEDDKIKLDMRKMKRGQKKDTDTDDTDEMLGNKQDKKTMTEEQQLIKENEEFKRKLDEKRKRRKKAEDDARKNVKELKEKQSRIQKEMIEEDERLANLYGGGKPKPSTRLEEKSEN